jgi:hypothetical protein
MTSTLTLALLLLALLVFTMLEHVTSFWIATATFNTFKAQPTLLATALQTLPLELGVSLALLSPFTQLAHSFINPQTISLLPKCSNATLLQLSFTDKLMARAIILVSSQMANPFL